MSDETDERKPDVVIPDEDYAGRTIPVDNPDFVDQWIEIADNREACRVMLHEMITHIETRMHELEQAQRKLWISIKEQYGLRTGYIYRMDPDARTLVCLGKDTEVLPTYDFK